MTFKNVFGPKPSLLIGFLLLALFATAPAVSLASDTVFDDMEHGDPFNNGGGSGAGGAEDVLEIVLAREARGHAGPRDVEQPAAPVGGTETVQRVGIERVEVVACRARPSKLLRLWRHEQLGRARISRYGCVDRSCAGNGGNVVGRL